MKMERRVLVGAAWRNGFWHTRQLLPFGSASRAFAKAH